MAVVSVAQVRSHLNISRVDNDGEIQAFIDAAVAAIGERVGPLEPTAKTVRVRPTGRILRVPAPATTLTSVVDADGVAVSPLGLFMEPASGLISANDGSTFTSGYYVVTYMAGRDPVPADLKLAVMELVRHFWDTQRGPTRRPGSTASETTANSVPGAAYLLPFRVSELLKPHMPILVGI